MNLNPYLMFDGTCRAAFEFYADALGGTVTMMMTHADSPVQDQTPPEWRDRIMHARLTVGDIVLMGSDSPPGRHQAMQGFSVSLNVDCAADAERIFHALAEGGTVGMPMQQTFWAVKFGMAVDRFGTPWIVNCELAPQAASEGR